MCGIIAYAGPQSGLDVVLSGLKRMEYRGYDSAGVAVVFEGNIASAKKAGKLANLEAELQVHPLPTGQAVIGHTRWATHGAPTDQNAHPHVDPTNRFAVIHNGIIENFADLRAKLETQGVEFKSETDTEVVVHLVAEEMKTASNFTEAVRLVCLKLEGTFTLIFLDAKNPGLVVGARRNSPLVVGKGKGENFLASDVVAFIEHTRDAIELGQDQIVTITADSIEIIDFAGNPATTKEFHVDWDSAAAEKGGYKWFMLKEIDEQPAAISDTLLGRYSADGRLQLDESRISDEELREIDKIIIVACGTASYAGYIAKYAIEHWARIPCEVEIASEFRYRDPIVNRSTLVVAISQSGETLDTLMAIRHAREQRAKVLAICNTNGSSIPRESDAVIYTHAGPEIAVASTKGFTSQIVAAYILALYLAQVRGAKYGDEIKSIMDALEKLPAAVSKVLQQGNQITELAISMVSHEKFLFLGRHAGFPVALEGALKLKEIAYVHAEGFAAGELKHGPIALIDEGLPVFVIVPPRGRDQLHDKTVSNIQEVRARGARTIVLAEKDDDSVKEFADVLIELPAVPTLLQPVVAAVPLQIFACALADARGHDVDQPRNLAKSVTVE